VPSSEYIDKRSASDASWRMKCIKIIENGLGHTLWLTLLHTVIATNDRYSEYYMMFNASVQDAYNTHDNEWLGALRHLDLQDSKECEKSRVHMWQSHTQHSLSFHSCQFVFYVTCKCLWISSHKFVQLLDTINHLISHCYTHSSHLVRSSFSFCHLN